jgi:hypothetical protein
MTSREDYAQTGFTISEAMIDLSTRYPDKDVRPDHVVWGGLLIKTADCSSVPTRGILKLDILSRKTEVDQGVDLNIKDGAFRLRGGEEVSLLRTWADDRYEDSVEYPYYSKSGRLHVWNVYKIKLPNGIIREEKWTGNAGFWIEIIDKYKRIYHCSDGSAKIPDFSSFIFRVVVAPL